jgi:hypothetical protein
VGKSAGIKLDELPAEAGIRLFQSPPLAGWTPAFAGVTLQYAFCEIIKPGDLEKIQKISFPAIPAKGGIQSHQIVVIYLHSGFHRRDDLIRNG